MYSEVESVDHKAVPFLIIRGPSMLFSIVAAPILTPNNSARGILSLHNLTTLTVSGFIDDSHSDKCEVIPHCGFHLHFSDD